MPRLVTIDEARRQLNLTADDMADPDIAATVADKAEGASDIVVDYLKRPDHGWDEDTTPRVVKDAILLVLGALFENREGGDPISDAVKSLLWRQRDPALR